LFFFLRFPKPSSTAHTPPDVSAPIVFPTATPASFPPSLAQSSAPGCIEQKSIDMFVSFRFEPHIENTPTTPDNGATRTSMQQSRIRFFVSAHIQPSDGTLSILHQDEKMIASIHP
jgi:hypothetical protein